MERQPGNALAAEVRHRVDVVSEIAQPPGDGWDVEDANNESDVDSDRSFGSAPRPQDGEAELNGWNELEWPGMVYRGYWRENHMHGKGMLKSDVGIFSGDFIMHKITGVGRYDFSDGRIYIGEFLDNNFNGQVILFLFGLIRCCNVCCSGRHASVHLSTQWNFLAKKITQPPLTIKYRRECSATTTKLCTKGSF